MSAVIERPFVIRTAVPTDAAAIAALYREVAAEDAAFAMLPHEVPAAQIIAKRIAARVGARGRCLVAHEGPTIVGMIDLRAETPSRRSHGAELVLAVASTHRRRGLARELLTAAQAWAHTAGIEVLRVAVRVGNEAALRLYAAASFVEDGRTPRAIKRDEGAYEDVVHLSLWIA